jgi:Zn-dependent protease
VIGAVLLLASLLAHELTHAVVARRAGITVSGVTLWMLGGIASLGSDAKTPKTEFRVAVSGPGTSLMLAALFAGAAAGLHAFGAAPIVVGVASWLSGINLLLGLFNLLPGAPLDGGRILRAYLWRRHGDPVRAAVGAARGGRIIGFIVIGLGLLQFVAGSLVGGVWMAFIGWFPLTVARTEENQVLTRQSLAGVRVADAMTAHPGLDHCAGLHPPLPAGRPPLGLFGRGPRRVNHRTDYPDATTRGGTRCTRHHVGR